MKINCISYSVLISVFFLSACSVGEDYRQPVTPEVKDWKNENPSIVTKQTKESVPLWWKNLNDTTLNRLVEEAVRNNYDLKIAKTRIDEARALSGRAEALLLPDINLSGSVTKEGNQSSRGGLDATNSRSEIGVSGSWDLDLFGGKRSESEASAANLGSAEANYRQALQTLLADVARTYVDLRTQQQLLLLTEKNLGLQKDTLRATKLQFEAKAAAKLDVLRAEAQVSSTSAEIPSIRAALAAKRHRISVLTGKSPQDIDKELMKSAVTPYFNDKVIMATPVAVIANRPDIQGAEFKLREQAALKNARTADIFPKITLSGFFGAGTASLYSGATPWSMAANLLMPVLNFGRIESEIEAADARKQQAFAVYHKTVLEAIEDVENALVQYTEEKKRYALLEQSVTAQREAVRLARLKYEAGDAVFIDVLIAEEKLLNTESSSMQSRAAVTRAAVNLYAAMGIVAPVEAILTKHEG